ncbi:hypothetical protein [Cupriavidus sp. 2SB]|uniref:hypothetical protein n=1 Tax=unclassified Cupriavidus TaxID=2640874 RepID=UPI0010F772D2|nr:hypothetical protein [Cupriavidus sp. 2SB]
MKAKSLRTLAVAALAVASTAHAATKPTPEAVTDLFLRTLVLSDTAAMQSLNDYTRPVRKANKADGDFINIPDTVQADKDYAKDLAPVMLEQVKLSDKDKAALVPAVEKLMQSVRDAQKRSVCTVGKSEPITQDVPKNMLAVSVAFDCKVVSPPEKISGFLQRASKSSWNTAQYREAIDKLRVGYENAPLTQAWQGALPLTAEKKNGVWQNIFPRESIDVAEVLF